MLRFLDFLKEEASEGAKLKHIHHAEDRPLLHGHPGFEHAAGALEKAHNTMVEGKPSEDLSMKYDGSPAVVFGHHPETGKFFVASKSAFNKNPKINYTSKDVDTNHGHAPGLAAKLKAALKHLPKVAPKQGVYQGDIMHTPEDQKHNDDGSVSFTPNTITYTARGKQAEAVKKSKLGVVVHTKYEGSTLDNMSATHKVDYKNFGHHPDVYHHGAEHDTSQVKYSPADQKEFKKHMDAAKAIHKRGGTKMYTALQPHMGDNNHLVTYINQTVRTDEKPSVEGLKKHIKTKYQNMADKVKTEKSKSEKLATGAEHINHIESNKTHYNNALEMHSHLQAAKNVLVRNLESHEGGYEHHISGTPSKPEGFVISHEHQGTTEPTKLVNRSEFAKQNLLKVR